MAHPAQQLPYGPGAVADRVTAVRGRDPLVDSHRRPELGGRRSEVPGLSESFDREFALPTSDVRPPTSDLRPPTSDVRPPTSDLRPPASGSYGSARYTAGRNCL